ncbi:MAG: DUF3024 domain-containing protein [bacterium]
MENGKEDQIIKKIEEFFEVPERVADKVKNVAEKVKGGYVLFETRPCWDSSPGPWTKLPVAKIVFHKSTQIRKLYWMRASGKWELYGQYKTLNRVLRTIEEDKHGCFWG